MSYAADHLSALLDIRDAGAAVTFTVRNPGVPDPLTGLLTGGSSSSVAGQGLQLPGNQERYRDLELIGRDAITLLFAATTYGEKPAIGSTFTFGGDTWTVKAVDPFMPDGTALIMNVIGAR
jgi:hypothetical protein